MSAPIRSANYLSASGGITSSFWATRYHDRFGVTNDLFVLEPARGSGVADALIEAYAQRLSWPPRRPAW